MEVLGILILYVWIVGAAAERMFGSGAMIPAMFLSIMIPGVVLMILDGKQVGWDERKQNEL